MAKSIGQKYWPKSYRICRKDRPLLAGTMRAMLITCPPILTTTQLHASTKTGYVGSTWVNGQRTAPLGWSQHSGSWTVNPYAGCFHVKSKMWESQRGETEHRGDEMRKGEMSGEQEEWRTMLAGYTTERKSPVNPSRIGVVTLSFRSHCHNQRGLLPPILLHSALGIATRCLGRQG